jgi:hypothetical protein
MFFQTNFEQISNVTVDFLHAFHPRSLLHSLVLLWIQAEDSSLNCLHFNFIKWLLNADGGALDPRHGFMITVAARDARIACVFLFDADGRPL